MTMLQNAISVLQIFSSAIQMCGCLFCSQSWHAVEQIVNRTVIWDAMALMWSHCNGNAAKCDFSITNDYVSIERVLMFLFLLARICCWTNNRGAGDLTLHDAHVGWLYWQCFKTRFQWIKVIGYSFCSQSWHVVKQIWGAGEIRDAGERRLFGGLGRSELFVALHICGTGEMSTEINAIYLGRWGNKHWKSRRIYVALGHDEIRSVDYFQFLPQPPGSLVMWDTEWPNKWIGLFKEIFFMNNDI